MPNVCVLASASGEVDTIEVEVWPDLGSIQKAVGGAFAEVPTSFRLEFDATWGSEAGSQETVVYCNEAAILRGLPPNSTSIADAINKERGENGPLLGDLLIVSGSPEFMAHQD